jgi:hypothetical protein
LIHIKRPGLGCARAKRTIGSGSARRNITSVVRLVKETELGSVFDDQATKAMGEAFEAACKDLDEARQSSVVYEALAKRIIEIAKSGERWRRVLCDPRRCSLERSTSDFAESGFVICPMHPD